MRLFNRRTVLLAIPAATLVQASGALAVDALPDARFVGFCQAVNEFDIASGQLALARSANENVRGYASRSVADATDAAQRLAKSRQEAGVSYAPDGAMGPKTTNLLQQLNAQQGPAFDTAYANAQLSVQTDSEAQLGAYSQNGKIGPFRRYAQEVFPMSQRQLENAKRLAGSR